MKRLAIIFCFYLFISGTAVADIINGVEVGAAESTSQPKNAEAPNQTIAPRSSAKLINFDDLYGPCTWSEGLDALRDEYAHLGVAFSGPGIFDGGVVFSECGGWGVSGYSPTNFLVFYASGYLNNGGVPLPPETISFTEPQTSVQMNAAGEPGNVTLSCYNSVPSLVDSDSLSLTTAMQTLAVSGSGITSCQIDSDSNKLIVDDIAFYAGPTNNQISIDNGFIKLDTTGGFGPFAIDCAGAEHYGRMIVDEENGMLYICTKAGWLSK